MKAALRLLLSGPFIVALAAACFPDHGVGAEDSSALFLDVFPPSVAQVPEAERGKTAFSFTYTPSGSVWAEGLDERMVYHAELKHTQDEENSFDLRFGKGGQIYSLRGAFGESVPPSWRDGSRKSPWNDEVWQFVAVCPKYNGLKSLTGAGALSDEVLARFKQSPYEQSYFIHNSGAYIPGDAAIRSLYCPLLASCATADGRAYRTVNWGLVPQVRTMHRSPLLYYCQTRDVGDGVIELTWVVHNFSAREDVVFDWMNAPWGGTRVTSLPFRYVSMPDGQLRERESVTSEKRALPVRETGGWSLASASEEADSPSLALVFGRDRHWEKQQEEAKAGKAHGQVQPSLYRSWRAGAPMYKTAWKDWRTRPVNSFRNYDVDEVIPRIRLAPGTSIWYRSFLVVGRRDLIAGRAASLVDQVDYGLLAFDPADTPTVPVFIQEGNVVREAPPASDAPAFVLFSRPVPGTAPLFLIEQTETGRQVITTDPYLFVDKEPLDLGVPPEHPQYDYYRKAQGYSMDRNHSNWKRLLGYAYVSKPADGAYAPLSKMLQPAFFPEPDTYHRDLWVMRKADVAGAGKR